MKFIPIFKESGILITLGYSKVDVDVDAKMTIRKLNLIIINYNLYKIYLELRTYIIYILYYILLYIIYIECNFFDPEYVLQFRLLFVESYLCNQF